MVIAGPNLSLDRMIDVSHFDLGHIHRAERVQARIGGGGANAARVARALQAQATLITMIPDPDPQGLPELLGDGDVTVEWVKSCGQLRTATILLERRGRVTVLNEPGPAVSTAEWEAYLRLVVRHLRHSRLLLCSGSLPPGAAPDGYAQLAHEAQKAGAQCIVDVAGDALAEAVRSGKSLVVPNLAEAEILLHGPRAQAVAADDDPPERAQDAARQLLDRGTERAVVTAGKAGAAYAERNPDRSGWIAAPSVVATNVIGAGDAFACALGLRLQGSASLEEAVSFATAVAAAQVESSNDDLLSTRVEALLHSVEPPPVMSAGAGGRDGA
jgi:1-phosphofructokinase